MSEIVKLKNVRSFRTEDPNLFSNYFLNVVLPIPSNQASSPIQPITK